MRKWKEHFFIDEKTRLACYKAMQEVIERCMDIVSTILKDIGEFPKDDYTNVEILESRKLISKSLSGALKELNGLRNRIVHEYNGLADEIAITSFEELLPHVKEFLEVVRKWLKEKS